MTTPTAPDLPQDERLDDLAKKIAARPKLAPGFIAYIVLAILTVTGIGGVAVVQHNLSVERTALQRVFCLHQNEQALRNRVSLIGQAENLIEAAARSGNSDSTPAQIAAYLAGATKSANDLNPLRDCSPVGVKDYNTNPPLPPAGCVGNGKGYCANPEVPQPEPEVP